MRQERLICLRGVEPGVPNTEIRQCGGAAEVACRRADLTGVLVYTGRHFFQVAEGAPEEIGRLLERMQGDHRYGPLHVLCHRITPRRQYDAWRFLLLDNLDLADEVDAMARKEASPQQAEDLAERLYHYALQTQ